MNIYDLAIEELIQENNESCKTLENRIPNVFKALERAKKVEKELEEYKISDKSKEESSIEYYNMFKETKRKLKKVEELLGLYKQYYNRIPIGTSMYKVELEIARLEKELEELK